MQNTQPLTRFPFGFGFLSKLTDLSYSKCELMLSPPRELWRSPTWVTMSYLAALDIAKTLDHLTIVNIGLKVVPEDVWKQSAHVSSLTLSHNYLDNLSEMLVDDYDYINPIDYEDESSMEDGNNKYFTFQSIGRRIYFILNIGDRISPKCGYVDDYPEEVIPYFLFILKLFFPSLKFTRKFCGMVKIWNLDAMHNVFIQHLFLILRNIQNSEFDFEQWVKKGGVQDRKENKDNEFSISTKK